MEFDLLLSKTLHPLVVLPVSAVLILYMKDLSLAASISWVSVWVLSALIPTAAVAWRTGKRGFEVLSRKQRNRTYLVGISCLGIALAAGKLLSAPPVVTKFGVFAVVSAAIFGVANRINKVSIHTGALTFAAGVFLSVDPLFTAAGVLMSVPVAWSRVKLDRHTRLQVFQGAALGLVCGAAAALL